MNGSDVWGSSAPYGDVLPVFKWNIYKRMSTYFPFKTVIIDDSLQNTLGEKKCQESFGNFLISLPTGYWYSCQAQSVDLRNLQIAQRDLRIHTLRN